MAAKTNKKDWSLVIWMFGWLLNFVTVVKRLATKLNMPFEAFALLTTEEGEGTLTRVLQLILQDYYASLLTGSAAVLPKDHYRDRVTYTIPDYDTLVKKWGNGNISYYFNGSPFTLHASCKESDFTPGYKVFYLHDAGNNWSRDERIEWGLRQRNRTAPNGYRPATHAEGYAFAEAHPELRDKYVFLGDCVRADKDAAFVIGVWWYGAVQIIDHAADYLWPVDSKILFVAI